MKDRHGEKREETVRRILGAAKDIFAEKGFAGARVDEIAQRTGVNKATLYYHIGDKKALYAEAIHDVIGSAASRLLKDIGGRKTPEEKIRAYLRTLAATVDENPQMPRMMMRELASGGQNLPDVFFQDLLALISTLTGIIDEGRKKGVFIDTIPLMIHFMAIGATIIYKSIVPLLMNSQQVPEGLRSLGKNVSGTVGREIERLTLKALVR